MSARSADPTRTFLFLYPHDDIIETILPNLRTRNAKRRERRYDKRFHAIADPVERERFKAEQRVKELQVRGKEYRDALDDAIARRYRGNGYRIAYAVLDGLPISRYVPLRDDDLVASTGMDYRVHRARRADGSYPYPSSGRILDRLGKVERLRIGGFHLWDCVQRVARTAHRRGIDTLVDEDLTQFFPDLLTRGFRPEIFPNHDFRELDGRMVSFYHRAREGKPWMWQELRQGTLRDLI